jgi:hypothetical protein
MFNEFNDVTIKRNRLDLTKNPLIEFTGSLGGKVTMEITPIGSIEFSHGAVSASISFFNPTNHTGGMSGSLQSLVGGEAYLKAGTGITISTGSSPAGQITIASNVVPGGSDRQVQFNDNGSFGGNANFTFDSNKVFLTGALANGEGAKAEGLYSHAEGHLTIAAGAYSHAGGVGTIASGSGQSVIGKYNKQNNSDSLFIVGNGATAAARSDIFLVNDQSVMVGSGSIGTDTFLHVGTYSVSRNTATFGGNVMVSGTLDIANHWSSYTPVINGTTTNPTLPTTKWLQGKYCRVGKKLSLLFNLSYRVSTGGADGTGAYLVHMPPGFTIDTNIAPTGTAANIFLDGISVGVGMICADSNLASIPIAVVPYDSSSFVLMGQEDRTVANMPAAWGSGNTPVHTMFPIVGINDVRVSFTAEIPIL